MTWLWLASSLLILAKWRIISLILLMNAILFGFFCGYLTPTFLITLGIISVIGLARWRYRNQASIRLISEILLIVITFALFRHLLPGFANPLYLDNVIIGPLSAPFSAYFNFDKALAPFILLLCIPTLFSCQAVKSATLWQWIALIIAVPLLLICAVFAGGLAFEWHFPNWLLLFIISNLLFVCLAEEALFRGYLQRKLTEYLPSPYLALFIAALLFGAAHFAGGPLLMLFATLAGVIYGLAWMWSGKLWLAVSFHFGLNLVHLLFFTYPIKVITG